MIATLGSLKKPMSGKKRQLEARFKFLENLPNLGT